VVRVVRRDDVVIIDEREPVRASVAQVRHDHELISQHSSASLVRQRGEANALGGAVARVQVVVALSRVWTIEADLAAPVGILLLNYRFEGSHQ
jgi:hypothetical protein